MRRHSAPQIVVDGVLVALAYIIAFHFRFDGDPPDALRPAAWHDAPWVVPARARGLHALCGLYAKWWRYLDPARLRVAPPGGRRRDARGSSGWSPCCTRSSPTRSSPRRASRSSADVARLGPRRRRSRSSCSSRLCSARRPLRAPARASSGPCAASAARKDARSVLIVGAGEGGQLVAARDGRATRSSATGPVGFVDDDPRKLRHAPRHGLRVLGTTSERELGRVLDECRARRGHHRHPLCARHGAPRRGRRLPRPRRSPSAPRRRSSSSCRAAPTVMRQVRDVQVEDVLGREPVPHGARARRRLPLRPDRARHRRRRLDRLRALPPDRPRRAAPAHPPRPRGGQPLRDPPRARGGPPLPRRRRRAGRLQGGGALPRGRRASTGPTWSSTPPPTSTCG